VKKRVAKVRLDGKPVGRLEELDGDRTRFTYSAEWLSRADAVPISLTMPLRAEPYESRGLHPFFDNLLPEGWLLGLVTKKLKIAAEDGFGLLLVLGADCVGAVEVVPFEAE